MNPCPVDTCDLAALDRPLSVGADDARGRHLRHMPKPLHHITPLGTPQHHRRKGGAGLGVDLEKKRRQQPRLQALSDDVLREQLGDFVAGFRKLARCPWLRKAEQPGRVYLLVTWIGTGVAQPTLECVLVVGDHMAIRPGIEEVRYFARLLTRGDEAPHPCSVSTVRGPM